MEEIENKYKNGKIYKIVDNTNQNIYIGSTFRELNERLKCHKRKSKCYINNKTNYVSSFEIIKNNDYKIELIENVEHCNNKLDLLKRERYYIEHNSCNSCINKYKNQGIKSEIGEIEYYKFYRENNKEKITEYNKKYRENNKEKVTKYNEKYREKNATSLKEKSQIYRENNKEKINYKTNCECGGCYAYKHKSIHFKTEKHQNYINNLSNSS
jgi:hypothetical protein